MTQIYNDPAGGSASSVGVQFNTFYWQKKALTEAAKEIHFGPLSSTIKMPKHMGKIIKDYVYLPILHDANINDQGIDSAGASTTLEKTIVITLPDVNSIDNGWLKRYAVGEGANDGAATTAAEAAALDIFKEFGIFDTNYATSKSAAEALDWVFDESNVSVPATGNLYGSSKDVGKVLAKMPLLGENGGRVNRVGVTRKEIQGSLAKYGFFQEYTKESRDFDTDAELDGHVTSEMVKAANEIQEDLLQMDLLNSAGVVRFGGIAIYTAQLTGEGDDISVATYEDFTRLAQSLKNNRTPTKTKRITGSRMVDTKTVQNAMYMHCGHEVLPSLEAMVDTFGNQAYISAERYAAAGTVANDEVGQIGKFKIIEVPEMMNWEGAGGTVSTNTGYRETGGNYDVFPLLVIGDGSFTTIGFQTSGSNVKFKIKHVKPESSTSYGAHDPYGEKGFMSIKWYYGFLLQRPERIGLLKVVAPW